MNPFLSIKHFLICISVATLIFLPCAAQSNKKAPMAAKGDKLYTQFSLYYEKDHHITTNYRKGVLVPVNSEVEFVKASKNEIVVRIVAYDASVKFVNEPDYSGEKIEGIF